MSRDDLLALAERCEAGGIEQADYATDGAPMMSINDRIEYSTLAANLFTCAAALRAIAQTQGD